MARAGGKLPVTLAVAGAVVVLDQLTKIWAVSQLEGSAPRELIGPLLQLHFVRNPGAAFSLGGNYTLVFSALAIVVAFVIVRTARTLASTWWAIVLGGMLGGAVGNLIDRMLRSPSPMRGHVVDFLELPYWPIFNIADMSLVGSAILAVILLLRGVEFTEVQSERDQGRKEPSGQQLTPLPKSDPSDGRVADGRGADGRGSDRRGSDG